MAVSVLAISDRKSVFEDVALPTKLIKITAEWIIDVSSNVINYL